MVDTALGGREVTMSESELVVAALLDQPCPLAV